MKSKQLSDMSVVEIFALGTAQEMIRFVRAHYNAPDFNMKIRLDFSPRRTRSWGGRRNGVNFMSLALHRYAEAQKNHKAISFNEYSSFAYDKVIGSIFLVNWKHALAGLIAHELAHAVQFSDIQNTVAAAANLGQGEGRIAHGLVWKNIYRTLRETYVNGKF